MAKCLQLLLSSKVASDGEGAVDGVLRQLIPEATDAVVGGVARIEVRMGKVEADIHQSHHHPFARISLRQSLSCVHISSMEVYGHRVGEHMITGTGLDAQHTRVVGHCAEPVDGDAGNMEAAVGSQAFAAILAESPVAVGSQADEGMHQWALLSFLSDRPLL